MGYSFDLKKCVLSIYDVFRVFGALYPPLRGCKQKISCTFRSAFMSPTANARTRVHDVGCGALCPGLPDGIFSSTLRPLRRSCSAMRALGPNPDDGTQPMNPLNIFLMFLVRCDSIWSLKIHSKNVKMIVRIIYDMS